MRSGERDFSSRALLAFAACFCYESQGKIACANVLSDLYAMGVSECDNMLMLLGKYYPIFFFLQVVKFNKKSLLSCQVTLTLLSGQCIHRVLLWTKKKRTIMNMRKIRIM